MAQARYVRLALGGYGNGAWAGEVWQTGVRMVEGDSGGVWPRGIRESLPQFEAHPIGGVEADATWTYEWAWEGATKFTKSDQQAMANAALTLWNALKQYAATTYVFSEVLLQAFEKRTTPSGYPYSVINGTNRFTLKSPQSGTGSGATQLPRQIAVAASLTTGARGPGGRGRMYFPFNNISASTGLVATAAQTAIGTNLVTFLSALNAEGPVVSVVNPTRDTYSAVIGVRVGNHFDTQRRRINAVAETYEDWDFNQS